MLLELSGIGLLVSCLKKIYMNSLSSQFEYDKLITTTSEVGGRKFPIAGVIQEAFAIV